MSNLFRFSHFLLQTIVFRVLFFSKEPQRVIACLWPHSHLIKIYASQGKSSHFWSEWQSWGHKCLQSLLSLPQTFLQGWTLCAYWHVPLWHCIPHLWPHSKVYWQKLRHRASLPHIVSICCLLHRQFIVTSSIHLQGP